jgi:hypothetical protein
MLIRILLIVLITVTPSQAKEWRGIVPLHSTRADVERLLGPPSTDRSEITFYDFEKEEVAFHYAKGPCGVKASGWNVPRDTVTSIWVTPNLLKLADLKLDESKYKKERDNHVQYIVNYINEAEGISYQVDTSDGVITLIKYFPAAKEDHLRCPASGEEGLEEATKFDSYSDIPFESEKKRLDSFAEKMRRYASTQAYIMAYAGRGARVGEAKARAARAKEYLVKVRGIDAKRIETVDGGYQEQLAVELYLVPLGAPPPLSAPTVEPSEVRIIKPSDARSNARRSTRPRCKR